MASGGGGGCRGNAAVMEIQGLLEFKGAKQEGLFAELYTVKP